jgi:hypothetical protein
MDAHIFDKISARASAPSTGGFLVTVTASEKSFHGTRALTLDDPLHTDLFDLRLDCVLIDGVGSSSGKPRMTDAKSIPDFLRGTFEDHIQS